MAVNRDEVVDLLSALVRIESITPWLIPEGSGEAKVAEFMAAWLEDLGLEVALDEVQDGRPNLLARLRGSGKGPTLCINAHSDTVGIASWPDQALVPRIDGDRMYATGSADDKAGCVAALLTLRNLVRSGVKLNGDVLVACVIDEEGVSIGTEHLVKNHSIDYAIVIEPTGLPLVLFMGVRRTVRHLRLESMRSYTWPKSSRACTNLTRRFGKPIRIH
jgi:acetylornithine deacetylase/succinyl-diaminopimelate desuccinylase-like protein